MQAPSDIFALYAELALALAGFAGVASALSPPAFEVTKILIRHPKCGFSFWSPSSL